MAMIEDKKVDGISMYGIEFFKRYQEGFGKVVEAEMTVPFGKPARFILKNNKGERMIFDDTFTSGYSGEGPKATLQVLRLCGFKVDDDFTFIHDNGTFLLKNRG